MDKGFIQQPLQDLIAGIGVGFANQPLLVEALGDGNRDHGLELSSGVKGMQSHLE